MRQVLLVALVCCLWACVDERNPEVNDVNPKAVALASRDDVLRELGNISASAALATLASRAVAQSSSCQQGGSNAVNTAGTREEPFDFFDVHVGNVDFVEASFFDCANTVDGRALTLGGPAEAGHSIDSGSGSYEYAVLGRGGAALTLTDTTGGARQVDVLTGRIEAFHFNGADDVRVKLTDHFTQPDYTAARSVGNEGKAFRFWTDGTSQIYDGPFSYASTRCPGGTISVETPTPITSTAGQLHLSSGSDSVIVTFNQDGSATLQFSSGATDALTAAEIAAAHAASQC